MTDKKKYGNYFLDLEKISVLDAEVRKIVLNLYHDYLNSVDHGRIEMATSYYHTLNRAGYLKNALEEDRREKINTVLHEAI
jgi:hypothetical protein